MVNQDAMPNQNVTDNVIENRQVNVNTGFTGYCDNFLKKSSLHGAKYLRQGTSTEKKFWTLSCIITLLCLISMVCYMQLNYPDKILTDVYNTHNEIWNVPFPAVTICPANRIELDKLEAYIAATKSIYGNIPKNENATNLFKEIAIALTRTGVMKVVQTWNSSIKDQLEHSFNTYSDSVMDGMEKVMPQVSTSFVECTWMGIDRDCNKMFSMAPTDMGYCFSFNRRGFYFPDPERNTSILHQFLNESAKRVWHVGSAGSSFGVAVVLRLNSSNYFLSNENYYGFKVLTHDPHTFPLVSERGIPVHPGQYVIFSMAAEQTFPVKEVEKMPVYQRQCALEDDVKLRYHKKYTFENCIVECRIQEMNKTCGCVPYQLNFARKIFKKCNMYQLFCLAQHEFHFISLAPKFTDSDFNVSTGGIDCNCPLYCRTIRYSSEISSVKLVGETEGKLYRYQDQRKSPSLDYVRLRIFFKDFTFISYKRDLRYTWNNVIADFGGITGLFIGFSIIGLIEILYYFILVPVLQNGSTSRVHVLPPEEPRGVV